MRKIATFGIKSVTPISLGWYEANTYDKSGFRVPSFRGSIRWWLRTIVAGVLYDFGLADETVGKYTQLIQNTIFGGEDRSSLIIPRLIKCNIKKLGENDLEKILYMKRGRVHAKHIRIELLVMGKRLNEAKNLIKKAFRKEITAELELLSMAYEGGKIRIKTDKEERYEVSLKYLELLSIYSTLLNLMLMGYGKGSRRALGAFSLTKFSAAPPLREEAQKIQDALDKNEKKENVSVLIELENIKKYPINVANIIVRLIEEARYCCELILKELGIRRRGEIKVSIPKFPALSKRFSKIYCIEVEGLWRKDPIERLIDVNEKFLKKFFLRSFDRPRSIKWKPQGLVGVLQDLKPEEKTTRRGVIYVTKAHKLGSYVLGLPRAARKPPQCHDFGVEFNPFNGRIMIKGRYTECREVDDVSGYAKPIFEESGCIRSWEDYRRASPLIITLANESSIVITFLKSADWPSSIWWWTTHSGDISIRTFQDALNKVEKYLDRELDKNRIWPLDLHYP